VQLLIILGAYIEVLPDSAHIANDERLHTICVECGYQCTRLLMFDISDLVLEFPEVFLFRFDQFLAPP
jgi:hypothetical protein